MIILLLYVLADFRLEYQKKQTVDLHIYMKDQRSALFEFSKKRWVYEE